MMYYIDITIKNNLPKRELRSRIKNKEYERLVETTKAKLIKREPLAASDTIKKPIYYNL